MYGTGRINEIISVLEYNHNARIKDIPLNCKLQALCEVLGLTNTQLDDMIIENSPVMRTVKGHAFETFFDDLIEGMGYSVSEVGGDQAIDRIVQGFNLQLKTPTLSGTRGSLVQYKTHKTHGAKSETESVDYYSRSDQFADFLVGLISYQPLNIIFIANHELPRSNISANHIKSPFTVNWQTHPGLNDFSRIGVHGQVQLSNLLPSGAEVLPRTSSFLNISSEVIIDTILKVSNFRMWDMAIRGFAREKAFEIYCQQKGISLIPPASTGRDRFDKADHVITEGNSYKFLQMKGISTNNCIFNDTDPVIATETQLTRGRVNDHDTQSRLYLNSDFDYLILAIDPPVASICRKQKITVTEFYKIPTHLLENHHNMPHRLKSLQKFFYSELQKFRF